MMYRKRGGRLRTYLLNTFNHQQYNYKPMEQLLTTYKITIPQGSEDLVLELDKEDATAVYWQLKEQLIYGEDN